MKNKKMFSSLKYEFCCSEPSWISFWMYLVLCELPISLFLIELVICDVS